MGFESALIICVPLCPFSFLQTIPSPAIPATPLCPSAGTQKGSADDPIAADELFVARKASPLQTGLSSSRAPRKTLPFRFDSPSAASLLESRVRARVNDERAQRHMLLERPQSDGEQMERGAAWWKEGLDKVQVNKPEPALYWNLSFSFRRSEYGNGLKSQKTYDKRADS